MLSTVFPVLLSTSVIIPIDEVVENVLDIILDTDILRSSCLYKLFIITVTAIKRQTFYLFYRAVNSFFLTSSGGTVKDNCLKV